MSGACDAHAGHVEWLGIDLPVDRVRTFLAEIRRVDIRGGKNGFGQILTGAALSLCQVSTLT
jgi:hypothetical protein